MTSKTDYPAVSSSDPEQKPTPKPNPDSVDEQQADIERLEVLRRKANDLKAQIRLL